MEKINKSVYLYSVIWPAITGLTVFFVFMFNVSCVCLAGKRYEIVILPFRDHTQMNLGEMVSDVLRSMVTQTGYFQSVDRDKIYETVITVLPSNLIIVDNATRVKGEFSANQIDLISSLDRKIIQRFCKKLRADYALRGSLSRLGDDLRIDAEIIDVKVNKILGFVDAEGKPEALLTDILQELTSEVALFCRNLNAYDDALFILGQYNQGQYTFHVAEKKLKELVSNVQNSIGIHAVLIVLYLSTNTEKISLLVNQGSSYEMGEKIIEEGEVILNLLHNNFDEKFLEVFISSGLDPFEEVAKIYVKRGDIKKAIGLYQNTIRLYPINPGSHYKEIGMLYIREGMEEEAIQALENSLDIDSSDNELRFVLVALLKKNKLIGRARKHLEECMKFARNADEMKQVREKINDLEVSFH